MDFLQYIVIPKKFVMISFLNLDLLNQLSNLFVEFQYPKNNNKIINSEKKFVLRLKFSEIQILAYVNLSIESFQQQRNHVIVVICPSVFSK